MTPLEKTARAICQQKCGVYGEPPCWSLDEYDGCRADCTCDSLARVALGIAAGHLRGRAKATRFEQEAYKGDAAVAHCVAGALDFEAAALLETDHD